MPGIVGLISKMPKPCAEAQLVQMVKAIRHERFYTAGTWIDEGLGVYVGWATKQGSFADENPVQRDAAPTSLFFSGEEYSSLAEGPKTILHNYEDDPEFPASLNGMFQGLIVDPRRGRAILFNDRAGMHRLCYHQSAHAFYFAAEAKAILAVRPELREPDLRSLGELLACSCVLENRTIFKDIFVLPAASAWTFQQATVTDKKTYFEPSKWENQSPLPPDDYYEELRSVLTRNLPLYFGGREKVGMTLTGGLDTRVIMACHNLPPESLPTYTYTGPYRECHDVTIGRRVAEVCRQPHQVLTVGDDFLKNFDRYAEHSVFLTEGTVDVYRAADLYFSEKAREIAPAKVVGTYGSEILRQAVMFKPVQPAPGVFHRELTALAFQAADTYKSVLRQHPVTFAAFKQSPWYHHGILALEQSQLSVRSPFLDSDFVRTVFRSPREYGPSGEDIRLRLIESKPALASFQTDRGVGGKSGLAAEIKKQFLELTFKAEYAYDYGMPKLLAKADPWLSGLHLERIFLGRHKLLHFRIWYRDALSEYIQEVLLDARTLSRPYVERSQVESMVKGHIRGDRNHTTAIHKLLTFELVHRLFFDAQCNS